jgi:primosomal protein N' (replication factor Y)
LLEIRSQSSLPSEKIRPATEILDREPLLSLEVFSLLRWAAGYYQHPLGDVLFHALPVRLRKGLAPTPGKPQGWRLTRAGYAIAPEDLRRAHRQASIMEALRSHQEGLSQHQLVARCGECGAVLRALSAKGWIEPARLESTPASPTPPPPLSEDQQQALDRMGNNFDGFRVFLLDGVTGSGKTEVYLSLVERALAQNRQILLLAPEIGLTPQLVQRFERRLGIKAALLHSGLAEGERERSWLAARSGKAQVVIGTRSAVFTPMPELGLILVDEEHDLSFKQQEGFRYSARDLAVMRAQRIGCPVVLGSATPALESLHNARQGRYEHIRLPLRVGSAGLPRMDLIDIRSSQLDGGLSPALTGRIREQLNHGQQVMLFLNRRGYAPVLTCHACGWLADCPRCDARMTLHLTSNLLWCHHCGHQQRTPKSCPGCSSPDLRPLGQGTERLESSLRNLFPEVSLARIDRDSTSRKGSLEKTLQGIRSGEFQLLIGTQMLAKGHHFPNVTLVALIDVDQGLFGADYRAPERMAQLIIQVAGRAGRADKPGQVLIQTRHPDHPLIQTLVHRGYGAFADEALDERRAAALPPFSFQALLRAESPRQADPMAFLQEAAEAGAGLAGGEDIEFWGPVPAPMERRAGKVRAHLLVQSSDRAGLQRWLERWAGEVSALPAAKKVRWSLDVDPQEVL